MMTNQTKNLFTILIVAFVYSLIFIPVNIRCASDVNMLVCSGPDEYAQFPYLMEMIKWDGGIKSWLLRFFDHKYYYYGYTFFFLSAICVLPVKILSNFIDGDVTWLYILILRQLSVVLMIAAILLLVYMWTGFKRRLPSICLFFFLNLIPAVFQNNTWWHPESLVIFFIVCTIFCLYRDNLAFGRWFNLSAVACGLAISTKILGFFFCICIPTYLLIGYRKGFLRITSLLSLSTFFVLIMVVTTVVTYPPLFSIDKAFTVFTTLSQQSALNNFGWGVIQEKGPKVHYEMVLKQFYGLWPLYFFAFGLLLTEIFKKRKKLLSLVILTWVVPYSFYLLIFVARKTFHYFMPSVLPLFSVFAVLFFWNWNNKIKKTILVVISAIFMWQIILFLKTDYNLYRKLMLEEQESPALLFYHELTANNIINIDTEKIIYIYTDTYIYLPPRDRIKQNTLWGGTDYSTIRYNPDFIILKQSYIEKFLDPKLIEISFDKERAKRIFDFYTDANNGTIAGYQQVFKTHWATIYKKKMYSSQYEFHFQNGRKFEQEGLVDQAIGEYRKSLQGNPSYIKALYRLSMLLSKRGENQQAIAYYMQMIRYVPNISPSIYYNIACLYSKNSDIEQALLYLERAVDKGFMNKRLLTTDGDLQNIRMMNKFQNILKRITQ